MTDQLTDLRVGQIVHIVTVETEAETGIQHTSCRAAMITIIHNAESGKVGLTIFLPNSIIAFASAIYSPTNEPLTWHWPESFKIGGVI